LRFYAPWCGHCKNLQPAYEKAAKNLQGLAKVAAVNCDEDANKQFCGQMGVQGFPTLKIVRPGKKPGRPVVEDYQGARAAKAIVDAVVEKIPNHVQKISDKSLDGWLSTSNDTAKAILFSDKGTTSALLRALAIDFLGSISFAQIRNKESDSVEMFGISEFPTFVLLPGGDKEGLVYDGEMKKEAMRKFLQQAAEPNPDPAPEAPKKGKTDKKKDSKKFEQFTEKSKSHKSEDASSEKLKATSASLEDEGPSTESPHPKVDTQKPIHVDESPQIVEVTTEAELDFFCFSPKSHVCILALLPAKADEDAVLPADTTHALASLGELQLKHLKRGASFPYFSVPATNPKAKAIRDALGLKGEDELEIVAVNAKRSWWRHYTGSSYGFIAIEDWVDVVRMNEGKREKLPESLIVDIEPVAQKHVVKEEEKPSTEEPTKEEEPQAEPEPEPEPATEATVEAEKEEPSAAEPEPPAEPETAQEEATEVPTASETAKTAEPSIKDEL
jgi:protein disulfide-isomerase A6